MKINWKKIYKKHEFCLGYIAGLLTYVILLLLAITITIITKIISGN